MPVNCWNCLNHSRCIDEKRWVEVNYANLCRDPETYSKPDPTLKCGYWRTWPQFYIQPIKVEWLYKRPAVKKNFKKSLTLVINNLTTIFQISKKNNGTMCSNHPDTPCCVPPPPQHESTFCIYLVTDSVQIRLRNLIQKHLLVVVKTNTIVIWSYFLLMVSTYVTKKQCKLLSSTNFTLLNFFNV